MCGIYAASLEKLGFEGPSGLLEGPDGLERRSGRSIRVDWEDPLLDIVTQTALKKYCSLIHGQPVLEELLDLKRGNRLVAADVERVRYDVFQGAFDFAGGVSYGSKDRPQAKEHADYNLKCLIAAALLDDRVGPAQLQPARSRRRMRRRAPESRSTRKTSGSW
jgi:2-methylcitrate dehydratase